MKPFEKIFNWEGVWTLILLYPIFMLILLKIFGDQNSIWISIADLFFLYLTSFNQIYYFEFYDNKLVVNYPTRIFMSKIKVIFYKDIERVLWGSGRSSSRIKVRYFKNTKSYSMLVSINNKKRVNILFDRLKGLGVYTEIVF